MIQHRCIKHQDKTGIYFCSKYNAYLCEECISCQDPKRYCKFRTSCIINEFVKHGTPETQRSKPQPHAAPASAIRE